MCVDVYSRYAFVKPLKTKSSKNVANKFEQILQEENEVPMKIHSDESSDSNIIDILIGGCVNQFEINRDLY